MRSPQSKGVQADKGRKSSLGREKRDAGEGLKSLPRSILSREKKKTFLIQGPAPREKNGGDNREDLKRPHRTEDRLLKGPQGKLRGNSHTRGT